MDDSPREPANRLRDSTTQELFHATRCRSTAGATGTGNRSLSDGRRTVRAVHVFRAFPGPTDATDAGGHRPGVRADGPAGDTGDPAGCPVGPQGRYQPER